MSTSPRAKHAAEDIMDYVVHFGRMGEFGRAKHVEHIAKKIDAATPKLREELRLMTNQCAQLRQELAQACAPLVAALEELVGQFEKVDKLYSKDREVIARARAAIAGTMEKR